MTAVKQKDRPLTSSSTGLSPITAIPPTAVILAILLIPLTAIKVTTTIQQAARIPTVCVGVRLPSAQVWVLSAPNKK